MRLEVFIPSYDILNYMSVIMLCPGLFGICVSGFSLLPALATLTCLCQPVPTAAGRRGGSNNC